MTYERPYLVSFSTSVADGKLTLASNSGGGVTNLGNLSPAAGGNGNGSGANGAGGLNDLSPSAGGAVASGSVTCANAFLDSEWNKLPDQRDCQEDRNIRRNGNTNHPN